MQTMPAKTRTAVAVGAVLVLMLMGGIYMATRGGTAPESMSMDDPYLTNDTATTQTTTQTGSATSSSTTTNPSTPALGTSQSTGGQTATIREVPQTHKVAMGETLYDISMKYYNSHIYAGDIELLNALENPDKLMVGQELKLPAVADLNR